MKIVEHFDEETVSKIETKLFEIELDKEPRYHELKITLNGYGNLFTETYKFKYECGKWRIVT